MLEVNEKEAVVVSDDDRDSQIPRAQRLEEYVYGRAPLHSSQFFAGGGAKNYNP